MNNSENYFSTSEALALEIQTKVLSSSKINIHSQSYWTKVAPT